GGTEKGLSRHCSGRVRRWKIVGSINQFPGGFQPVMGKTGLKARRTGSFDANLNVMPVCRVLPAAYPLIGNTGASCKGDPPVDDERLPVIAMIEMPNGPQPHPVVPGYFTATVFQDIENFFSDRCRTECVQEKFNCHAGLAAFGQSESEPPADIARPVD